MTTAINSHTPTLSFGGRLMMSPCAQVSPVSLLFGIALPDSRTIKHPLQQLHVHLTTETAEIIKVSNNVKVSFFLNLVFFVQGGEIKD